MNSHPGGSGSKRRASRLSPTLNGPAAAARSISAIPTATASSSPNRASGGCDRQTLASDWGGPLPISLLWGSARASVPSIAETSRLRLQSDQLDLLTGRRGFAVAAGCRRRLCAVGQRHVDNIVGTPDSGSGRVTIVPLLPALSSAVLSVRHRGRASAARPAASVSAPAQCRPATGFARSSC